MSDQITDWRLGESRKCARSGCHERARFAETLCDAHFEELVSDEEARMLTVVEVWPSDGDAPFVAADWPEDASRQLICVRPQYCETQTFKWSEQQDPYVWRDPFEGCAE